MLVILSLCWALLMECAELLLLAMCCRGVTLLLIFVIVFFGLVRVRSVQYSNDNAFV